MSVPYYDNNAKEFFSSTYQVDASDLYEEFLPLLKPQSLILDAGCGSGRDTLAFIQSGFKVTAFDASKDLAELASKHTGQTVAVAEFSNFQSNILFDAIWACASLLHVPPLNLPDVFNHLASFLKPEGIFYCSFKYGSGVTSRDGRQFTNVDENTLQKIILNTSLKIHKKWITRDLRTDRKSEKWMNAIFYKASLSQN
ncbi:methyltransferase domain-containing protein [Endozoicomonas gorgoniicola]|uniref:Methyltransferase domain-containing protein n=1 Tax=Endozoicomonas gorgoniicola TaxID=1234144 RepID=A0ABT3MWZ8_9GAMM|nr:class I SAM-dependent methyltransferase [Endozoicomonas gorgoniicola]MCW7553916.1 methyltransferase domain-containing protein [Endozoicomonas gorgoniicola]